MEKTENKPILVGVASIPFKFELSQLVEVRISDEWGEVKARAQYADGENQYLLHYKLLLSNRHYSSPSARGCDNAGVRVCTNDNRSHFAGPPGGVPLPRGESGAEKG
ncbi:hypothetical protein GNZ05_26695 [Escherichia coli]|uniref:Uncharacterized protein n=1 Tax=Escherichia coli TaxID=562 RepID=A0AAJ3D0G4_ECOLX|nr:hypothetical protein [Escherichia coli]MUM75711.1 hypothetical protein [Escherichia coli]